MSSHLIIDTSADCCHVCKAKLRGSINLIYIRPQLTELIINVAVIIFSRVIFQKCVSLLCFCIQKEFYRVLLR